MVRFFFLLGIFWSNLTFQSVGVTLKIKLIPQTMYLCIWLKFTHYKKQPSYDGNLEN